MEQRIAVVTGGTRGMGKAVSVALAREGNIVFALYRSDKNSADETQKMMTEYSSESRVVQCDISSREAIDRTVKKIGNRFGRIDILVNNAGIFEVCFIEEMTDVFFNRTFDTNFKGQLYMIQACVPYMKKKGYGRIVNASSIASSFTDCGFLAYSVSKASIDMLIRTAAGELAPYGITVNGYSPGIIHTDMTDEMIAERGNIQVKQIALNRFGDGEDVAALVCFLASPCSGYITGEIIGVDGGMFKVQNAYRAYEHAGKIGMK